MNPLIFHPKASNTMAILWSTRRTPFICILAFAIVFLASFSLHNKEQLASPIHDYFSHSDVLSACPSVHDTGRPPLDHSSQTCHPIRSKIPQFNLEVCYSERTCNEFTARIKRTSATECRDAESAPDPSEDPAQTRWMREQRGPDAFYLRTDGAERYSSVFSTYEGECTYSFDVRLKNPGDTYLQIWWTYERFTGFSETNASWPAMLLNPISEPILIQTCPSYCKTQISAPLLPNHKIHSLPPSPPPHSHSLPNCSGSDPIAGSFIPAHPLDVIYPPVDLPQPLGKPVVGRYGFVPEACTWRHAGLRFGDVRHCTRKDRKMKMFITGDSHGRVAYDSIRHRLEGNTDVLLESEKVGSKSTTIGQLDINFIWDPRGTDFLGVENGCEERVQDSDIIILSTVAHYDDMPSTYFVPQLREILTGFAACPYAPSQSSSSSSSSSPKPQRKHILLYAPAVVQRQDQWVREFKDHGTNIRFQHWRDESLKIAKELGWMFVDQYELSLPHSLEALYTDMAHFLANDAMDPIIDEVLGKAGLCD